MSVRLIFFLLLNLTLLSSCATTQNQEQPYMGNTPNQDNVAGSDLYNANAEVQKPQSTAWGWLSN